MIIGVVVTHASPPAQLERCLTALLDAGGLDRLIVIDNGGSAVVATVPDRDNIDGNVGFNVELIRTDNRGYGAAANVGIARARELDARHVALLNDDVIVRSGWLRPLVEALDHDDQLGAVQPKLLFADREPATINSLGVALDRYGAGHDIGFGELDDENTVHAEIDADIDVFTGGAVLFRRAFLDDTGGFDERYFLYYEDVDLAVRGNQRGWRYRCVPGSVVEHIGSATTSADPERTRFLQERNRLWCTFRNADAATMAQATWLSIRRLRHRPRRAHAKALMTGLVGAPVRLWERTRRADTRPSA